MNYLLGIVAVIAALAGLIFGVNRWETAIEQRGYERAQAEYSAAAVEAEKVQRAEEQRRNQAQQEANDEHQKQLASARADAAAAGDAAVSLQKRLAAITANHATGLNSGAASYGATVAALGNVFGNCAERYSAMGEEADAARNAGLLCERYYDALKAPAPASTAPPSSVRAQVRSMLKH